MAPFASMYMIFLGIVGMGHPMISSVIEVLLSAISPIQLMAATVFGTGIPIYGKRPGPREILHWLREMASFSRHASTDESPEGAGARLACRGVGRGDGSDSHWRGFSGIFFAIL